MISQLFKRLFLGKAALVVLAVTLVLILAACGLIRRSIRG